MFRYIMLPYPRHSPYFLFALLSLLMVLPCSSAWAQTASKSGSTQTGTMARLLPAPERMPADLSKDVRLDRRISLHEVGTPFNVLLKKISSSDLTLTVETESAEQKLHINIKERSLRQLMQSLTDVFPGTWYARQDGNGYRYEMNLQTVRRRRHWWDLFLGEREKAFAAMRAAVLNAMRTPPQPPVKFVKDHTVEDGIDEETWRKIASEKTFFGKLPVSLQEQIANQVDEVPWYNLRGLVTSNGMNENALFVPLSAFPDEMQLKLKSAAPQTQGEAPNVPLEQTAYVRFTNFGQSVMASLVTLGGSGFPRGVGSMIVPPCADLLPLKLNQWDLPAEVKKRGKAAFPAWKELAAYQQSHFWLNDLPKQYPARELSNRIDVQEWLAETQGIEFVSDYYTAFRGVSSVKPAKLTRPLKEELDWQAAAQDLSWKKQAGIDLYLFRSNRWYRDDLLEIPAPILQRFLAYKKRRIELEILWEKQVTMSAERIANTDFIAELDGIADAVHSLTPWQLFNGLANVVVPADQVPLSPIDKLAAKYTAEHDPSHPRPRLAFEQDILGILLQYRTLMFYGGLSKEERAVLLAGRLDINALTPAQQQQVSSLLPILQFLQLTDPPRPGEPLLIGIRAEPGGYVGMPCMQLYMPSMSPTPPH